LGDYAAERDRASFIGKINSIGTFISIIVILSAGYFMDSLGFPFGENPEVFFIPFFTAAAIFALTVIASLFLVEKYNPSDKVLIQEELGSPSAWTLINRNKPFKRLLPVDAFFKFCMSTAWPIFPFVALSVADSWMTVAILWMSFNLPRGFGQNFGGKLADRYNKKIVIWLARLSFVTVPLLYAAGLLTDDPLYLLIAAFPSGFALGAEETSISAYCLDCSTEDTKGRYYSMLLTAEGITAFAGSLFSGFLFQFFLGMFGVEAEFSILFFMLIFIGFLRFISAMMHFNIYKKPLDFELDLALDEQSG
ncbi:MAG: MFS transporter, partial [Candidatus Hodarchaeales archaeon]